jgi:hypothetical protein
MQTKKRLGMVDWYSPTQLAKTGIDTLVSTVLGASIDTRKLQAVEGNNEDCIIDYSDQKELCFDYMADTGDGWDSTYSLAYLLMRPEIKVSGQRLKRADVLIMGGDEVYPVASPELYTQRLIEPFNQAAKDLRNETSISRLRNTDLFLIPGNHDWYDSLSSFSRRFFAYKHNDGSIQERTPFSQLKNRQMRSYFVLKLPSNWELWGLDIQLGKDVDNQQYTFFDDHSQSITANTKIIVCIAEPEYVYGEKKAGNLAFTLDRITSLAYQKGAKVMVQLAGDVHNYQHYEIPKKTKQSQKYVRHHIVSGGGGAFLHPTHSFHSGDEKKPETNPTHVYPEPQKSQELTNDLLWFALKHKGMSAFIAGLYVAFFWQTGLQFESSNDNFWLFPVQHSGSFILMLLVIAGSMAFAGFGSTKTLGLGGIHGLAHIIMAIICWFIGSSISDLIVGVDSVVLGVYLSRIITFLIGGLLGGTLFGVYLWISLNIFRHHHNEAFSALSCADYKNFLRCKFTTEGALEISVIGIEKSASDEQQHPVKTHLIERITIS